MVLRRVLALVLLGAVVSGCSEDSDPDPRAGAGDCTLQLRVEGAVFTSYGYTKRPATKHASAERAACDDTGSVETWTFAGYPPEKVLGTRFEPADSYAVYVADSVPAAERDRIFEELGKDVDASAPPAAAFATYRPSNFAMEALGGGTLAVRDGCLVLGYDEGGRTLVVLSNRTTMVGDTLHVVGTFGDRADMRIGDEVRFGGGYVDDLSGAGFEIPDPCSALAKRGGFLAQSLVEPAPVE